MIITHVNPDFDAIASVWLLKRFTNLESEEIVFVNTGNPDKELLEKAVAVVDTGKVYDPGNLRFDHHHLVDANMTCAALQVYQWIYSHNPTFYIGSLINLVFEGDTGRSGANFSRELGIHALLSGFKASFKERNEIATDQLILDYGFSILDTLALRLKNQAKAREELAEKVVYKSEDSLVWAIKHGSAGSSFAAFDEGARIVVFEGEPIQLAEGTTYPIGVMRVGEWQEPRVGELVGEVINNNTLNVEVLTELKSWFCHPGGFFAGRGTAKAPVFNPVIIDLNELAQLIDKEWIR